MLTGLLIAMFATFFMVKDGRQIWSWVVGLFPRDTRARADGAGLRAWHTLISYVRATLAVALVDAIGIGVGAAVLGVPLALPLGVLVFLGSFVPIVGATVTGLVAVLVALVAKGPVTALLLLGVVLVVQQVEGHVLQPLLLGRAVKVHPLAVVLAIATGVLLAGIVGALRRGADRGGGEHGGLLPTGQPPAATNRRPPRAGRPHGRRPLHGASRRRSRSRDLDAAVDRGARDVGAVVAAVEVDAGQRVVRASARASARSSPDADDGRPPGRRRSPPRRPPDGGCRRAARRAGRRR